MLRGSAAVLSGHRAVSSRCLCCLFSLFPNPLYFWNSLKGSNGGRRFGSWERQSLERDARIRTWRQQLGLTIPSWPLFGSQGLSVVLSAWESTHVVLVVLRPGAGWGPLWDHPDPSRDAGDLHCPMLGPFLGCSGTSVLFPVGPSRWVHTWVC